MSTPPQGGTGCGKLVGISQCRTEGELGGRLIKKAHCDALGKLLLPLTIKSLRVGTLVRVRMIITLLFRKKMVARLKILYKL